ncbi:MAG: hypothetical protein A2096_16805 [Spirochaetes bacterium GWF1_41_5]|nr:MAG: hypothetical protein A2096_16805 [Spirochaetes bacterium GWF1_41_5]HBE03828.1 hypothetical protein [Spirochaetia bacterium]
MSFLENLPDTVREHIKKITKTSGLPDTEESVEKIAEAWLEKKKIFEEKTAEEKMEETAGFDADEERGCLVMTYSGSLVSIGPKNNGAREAVYTSIGLRQDVPSVSSSKDAVLKQNIVCDDIVAFSKGPVKSTSQIFKIAVCSADLSAKEQAAQVTQVTRILQDEFLNINKTIISE